MTNTPNKTSGREWLVTAPSDSDLQEGVFSYRAYRKESVLKHVWAKRIEQAKDAESGMFHVVDSEWRTQAMALAEVVKSHVETHWFDGTKKENEGLYCPACMFCDMNDSGERRNPDGHDERCTVSRSYIALAKFDEWMRKGRG